jgi:uncharacterized protein (TIGR04255 family)
MDKNVSELPPADQVVFEDAPLEEVVCQLRFNEILIIKEKDPAQFQERIRKDFPLFVTSRGLQINVGGTQPIVTDATTWQFSTPDKKWTASLTSKFLALKTTAYEDYPGFWSRLEPLFKAFQDQYEPPFYTRVGLRYVNRFIMEREDANPIDWTRFLHQRVAGEYGDPTLRMLIAESSHQAVLKLKHGHIGWRYSRDVGNADKKEAERFTLDFDHFTAGRVTPEDIPDLLRIFNENLYRLFVWCLTKEGKALLKPRPKVGSRGGI